MAEEQEEPGRLQEAEALAELTLCENLAQTSGWAARWSAAQAEADGALLWAAAPRRAEDGRDAPRDRALDQPLRPFEGVRLDDRPEGARARHRLEGRGLPSRGGRLALAARRGGGRPRGVGGQRELRGRPEA